MFSGAGVLIFMNDCVLLFRERSSRGYTEPGGRYDQKHENIEDAAIDELYEETCCLFDIHDIEHANNFVDVTTKRGAIYRLYIINIVENISDIESSYYDNLDRLTDINAKKYYLETDDITCVKIEDILSGKKYIKDVHNTKIKLRDRLSLNVRALFNEIETITPLNVCVKKIIKRGGLKTFLLKAC